MKKVNVFKRGLSASLLCLTLCLCAQTPSVHGSQLRTPKEVVSDDTLSILSFNDFHGAFAKEKGVPGASELVQMVLDQTQKNQNTIVVSVGDNFSGSYFSRITKGKPLPEMFAKMNVALSAVGNHEFDWGLPYLTDTASVYTNFMAANIVSKDGKALTWAQPYQIIDKKMKNGNQVKIAFVGLTTTDTESKTNPENLKGLRFTRPDSVAIKRVSDWKKEGKVDLIVLLMHIGTNMEAPGIIEEENAKQLPYIEGVDAIISGHSHKVVLSTINQTPIIQAGVNGTHVGKLNFKVSTDGQRTTVAYIGGDTIKTGGTSNPEIDALVNQTMKKYHLSDVLTVATDNLIHDRNINKFNYTAVGAYVTASYVDCFKQNKQLPAQIKKQPIFGVNHYGGLRTSIWEGEVTKLRAGNVLPFGGNLVAYQFTGKRLKELLNDGRKNKNGYLQSSYLELTLNKDGKIIQLKDTRTNQIIADETQCIVVLDSFITSGGDGYNEALFKNQEIPAFNKLYKETTSTFINYLQGLGSAHPISTEQAPKPIIR